jgi:histidine ammonia-lyase
MAQTPIALDSGPLTIDQVVAVARHGVPLALTEAARVKIRAAREVVERAMRSGKAHYGINTGFGSLSRARIDDADLAALQRNLLRSHAAGVGEPFADEVVRGMLAILAASLARGASGVREELVDAIVAMLNAGVTPVVPSIGSVGASGDLAPLAHACLVLMGEGTARHRGRTMPGGEALAAAGLRAIDLDAKEGLALINGTHLMAARACLILADARNATDAALVACAMSIDAARASHAFLDPRAHELRNQPGQVAVAARLRALLASSEIVVSHAENDPRVQDPYSFRCSPQVLGAALDAIAYVRGCVERELHAVTDNPLVVGSDIISAGNFHGMPLAIPLDAMAIALAHVAGISERRTFWILSAFDKEARLPAYLAPNPGLHSGLMIAQYTAAACCNELITLAGSASVANLSTSAGMEDYNSFGPRAAAKAARAVELVEHVVAIEVLCAAEGLDRHRPLKSGPGVEHARRAVRARVTPLTTDRSPSPDVEALAEAIRGRALVQ